jgi:hypothetical protein
MIATCCWTALCGDHPVYEGVRLVVYNDTAQLVVDSPLRSPDRRIYEEDLSAKLRALLPPFLPPLAPTEWVSATETAARACAHWLHKTGKDGTATRSCDTSSLGLSRSQEEDACTGFMSLDSLIGIVGGVEVAAADCIGAVPKWVRLHGECSTYAPVKTACESDNILELGSGTASTGSPSIQVGMPTANTSDAFPRMCSGAQVVLLDGDIVLYGTLNR